MVRVVSTRSVPSELRSADMNGWLMFDFERDRLSLDFSDYLTPPGQPYKPKTYKTSVRTRDATRKRVKRHKERQLSLQERIQKNMKRKT